MLFSGALLCGANQLAGIKLYITFLQCTLKKGCRILEKKNWHCTNVTKYSIFTDHYYQFGDFKSLYSSKQPPAPPLLHSSTLIFAYVPVTTAWTSGERTGLCVGEGAFRLNDTLLVLQFCYLSTNVLPLCLICTVVDKQTWNKHENLFFCITQQKSCRATCLSYIVLFGISCLVMWLLHMGTVHYLRWSDIIVQPDNEASCS